MAKVDRVLCPLCIFTSRYFDLIINDEGVYVCPNCNASFSYDELMQLYTMSQFTLEMDNKKFNPRI